MKHTSSKPSSTTPALKLRELLFEIGSEEIPAGMLPKLRKNLKQILQNYLWPKV
jgi:glycyl-tRNA synthetase beta subunit